jgi:hypothetical protein
MFVWVSIVWLDQADGQEGGTRVTLMDWSNAVINML